MKSIGLAILLLALIPACLAGGLAESDGDKTLGLDQNPAHQFTEPPQRSSVTVGNGNQLLRMPVDMYFQNSLYETLYYPGELQNMRGSITELGFFNDFASDLTDKPVKIWLGTSTLPDLEAGWIPSTELSLVFDGTLDLPTGENDIIIPLDPPFWYLNQQNLVLLVQRPMDSSFYLSSDRFRAQYSSQNRSRKAQSDATAYDPANPPSNSTLGGDFPQTRFTWIPVEVGTLLGTVTGTDNWPLQNATVQAEGFSAQTNYAGVFSLQLPVGTYSVTATATGYDPQTIPSVSISAGQTTTIAFSLVSVPANDPALPGLNTLLLDPRPNPMASETLIQYSLAKAGPVKVGIFDIRGRLIRSWTDTSAPAGISGLVWDGQNESGQAVSAGIYLLRLSAGEYQGAAKLILIK